MHRREWLRSEVKIVMAVVATSDWLHRCPRPTEVARQHRAQSRAGLNIRTITAHRPEIDLRAYYGVLLNCAAIGRLWYRWQGRKAQKRSSYDEIRGDVAWIIARIRDEKARGRL